jgi:hypothetical protein
MIMSKIKTDNFAVIAKLQAEIGELEDKVEIMIEALERLAKLGNEPSYGSSEVT